MIPKKYSPMLFSLLLSGCMSLLISGIATVRTVGITAEIASLWANAWLSAWLVAFPAVMFVAPMARKIVGRLTAEN